MSIDSNKDILDFKCFSKHIVNFTEVVYDQTNDTEDNDVITFLELVKKPKVLSFLTSLIESVVGTSESVKKTIEATVFDSPKFKPAVEYVQAVSDAEPLQRITALEVKTGLVESLEDKPEPTIPEQISELENKIAALESSAVVPASTLSSAPLQPIIPETVTEGRAVYLMQYLDKEIKETNGQQSMNNNDLKDFFTRTIEQYDPKLKAEPGQNLRKLKKDVIEKARQLFPNNIFINKNPNGRHETRVLYRSLPTVT
jgi:hypothetical protein